MAVDLDLRHLSRPVARRVAGVLGGVDTPAL